MERKPLNDADIRKAAELLRERAIEHLNADENLLMRRDNRAPTKPKVFRRTTKRDDALLTCVGLMGIVGLSAFARPLDWRLVIGCLGSGIAMVLAGIAEKNGHSRLIFFPFLIMAAVVGLWSMVQFGAKGPMLWGQSMPLIGIGAYGVLYVFYFKFGIKD